MSIELQPCAECARHVGVHAKVCPFCGASSGVVTHVPRNASKRIALVAAAAAAAVGLEGCITAEALYGVPCVEGDGGTCGQFTEDSGSDASSDAEAGADGSDGSRD